MEPPTPRTETESIGPSTYPNTSTNNNHNRLQQSCTRCRERKIKCDRNSPCRACVARNCQDECEYVRTNEDRYHISKAKEIEGLRRELKHLKRRLADVEAQDRPKQHGNTAASDAFEADYQYAGRFQKRRIENRDENEEWNRGYASRGIYDSGGSVQNGFITPDYNGFESANLDETTATADMAFKGYQSVPHIAKSEPSPIHNYNHTISTTLHSQLQQHPQPDFWRGKHAVLETIYQIICDCDDFWVPSIIEIVRSSLSPEEALLAIQRMLLDNHAFVMADDIGTLESLSSSIPASFVGGGGVDMSFTGCVSPSDQSPSSGEG
ncbi:hypothetical protein UA08_00241 [Talaromyces atroroseus]|uniref:Zn(2)-C6 fungal-type domain-containing protein n=1 Tax=Talaromyces atroroseus TaxID=1441469 RepID=A0A225ASR3_TALAT|nr:hypothetical protein UA08_00241 [Talaromyces atroroseus]OKL64020.1 hypothetical protein UA08_00241 [Talaromyces atroroseus]